MIPFLERLYMTSNPGRFAESLVLLFIAWWRVRTVMTAHLTKIEVSLNTLTQAVSNGFAEGEKRFSSLENRVLVIETKNESKFPNIEHKGEAQ